MQKRFQKYFAVLCFEVIIHQNRLLWSASPTQIHQIRRLRKHQDEKPTKHLLNISISNVPREGFCGKFGSNTVISRSSLGISISWFFFQVISWTFPHLQGFCTSSKLSSIRSVYGGQNFAGEESGQSATGFRRNRLVCSWWDLGGHFVGFAYFGGFLAALAALGYILKDAFKTIFEVMTFNEGDHQ